MAKTPTSALAVLDSHKGLPSLDECIAAMRQAHAEFNANKSAAIQSAVSLGEAAAFAKEQIPHGGFTDWVRANFDFSEQWVRVCMRAAEAWTLGLADGKQALLEEAQTVQAVADLLKPLKGEEPVKLAPRKAATPKLALAPKGPKAHAPWDNAAPEEVEDVAPKVAAAASIAPTVTDASLTKRKADLDAFEKKLDKREKKLDARTAELDERERLVALAEAALEEITQAALATRDPAEALPVDAPTAHPKRVRAPRKAKEAAPADNPTTDDAPSLDNAVLPDAPASLGDAAAF